MSNHQTDSPTTPSRADSLQAGTMLAERYSVEEVLGSGGMATVYRAEDTLLRRTVAIKVMASWLQADEAYARRFMDEAQSAARLNHPNVVTVYDTVTEPDRRFIVMEYVDGKNLDEERTSSEREAVAIAIQVAEALEYGHENGIIHCDVKPANILVGRNGRARLVDFGIARAATQTWAMATTVLGTAAYMAPEVIEGHRPGRQSDIYSLAIVLYEMLAGRLPFEGESVAGLTAQRLVKDPIPLRRLKRDVSPQLERVIMRALARNPERRPPTAMEFAKQLEQYVAEVGKSARSRPSDSDDPKRNVEPDADIWRGDDDSVSEAASRRAAVLRERRHAAPAAAPTPGEDPFRPEKSHQAIPDRTTVHRIPGRRPERLLGLSPPIARVLGGVAIAIALFLLAFGVTLVIVD
ncbi:MAG: protein kinase [Dehalococcoidia bacterium]|nr:protein kinase [Dehalococcoidia bacterium]